MQGRVDAKTGAVSGPAADLTRELARRLNVKYEITPLPSAGAVLESVRSGKMDIGFLAYEAARAEQVDFSDPYSSSGSAYAVRANSTLKSSADVDRAGVTIGAIAGQSPEVYVREHAKNARVESLTSVPPNAAFRNLNSVSASGTTKYGVTVRYVILTSAMTLWSQRDRVVGL